MSCECNKIGGPWITFDPECPAHGYQAQREQEEREQAEHVAEQRILALEEQVRNLTATIERLTKP